MIRFSVFKTSWGYFGLAGAEAGLLRTCLPADSPEQVRTSLLSGLPKAQYTPQLFAALQKQIIRYFEGQDVDFLADIPVVLDGFSPFARAVLNACRDVTFGRTTTYGQLAQKAGSPFAARAVGVVMARNPLPLIIPCHRVVRGDGKIGGFSAPGGAALKNKLLQFEQKALQHPK